MDINTDYDKKLKGATEKYLNRPAKQNELVNADNDSNLVTETLWQIIVEMEARITLLEKNKKL